MKPGLGNLRPAREPGMGLLAARVPGPGARVARQQPRPPWSCFRKGAAALARSAIKYPIDLILLRLAFCRAGSGFSVMAWDFAGTLDLS